MKNPPIRTCCGCRKKKNKFDLIRIISRKNGEIAIDTSKKQNTQGRGAYICKSSQCLEKVQNKGKNKISYSLKVPISILKRIMLKIEGKF